jgi:hypothetical protein
MGYEVDGSSCGNCYFNICTFGKRKEKTLVKDQIRLCSKASIFRIKFLDLLVC